jgi:hypothetical protein
MRAYSTAVGPAFTFVLVFIACSFRIFLKAVHMPTVKRATALALRLPKPLCRMEMAGAVTAGEPVQKPDNTIGMDSSETGWIDDRGSC